MYSGTEAWKCIMAPYRLPHVKTPYFVIASQYDAFQLWMNKVGPFRHNEEQQKYADSLAAATRTLMRGLRRNWSADAPMSNAVYSWSCYNHAMSLYEMGFDKEACNKRTVHEAFGQWLLQAAGDRGRGQHVSQPAFEWIEECSGFACGRACAGDVEVIVEEAADAVVENIEKRLPSWMSSRTSSWGSSFAGVLPLFV